MSDSEVGNVAIGYCLQEGILTRKWVPRGEDFVGEPIFQVVVPAKLQGQVFAHDTCS